MFRTDLDPFVTAPAKDERRRRDRGHATDRGRSRVLNSARERDRVHAPLQEPLLRLSRASSQSVAEGSKLYAAEAGPRGHGGDHIREAERHAQPQPEGLATRVTRVPRGELAPGGDPRASWPTHRHQTYSAVIRWLGDDDDHAPAPRDILKVEEHAEIWRTSWEARNAGRSSSRARFEEDFLMCVARTSGRQSLRECVHGARRPFWVPRGPRRWARGCAVRSTALSAGSPRPRRCPARSISTTMAGVSASIFSTASVRCGLGAVLRLEVLGVHPHGSRRGRRRSRTSGGCSGEAPFDQRADRVCRERPFPRPRGS